MKHDETLKTKRFFFCQIWNVCFFSAPQVLGGSPPAVWQIPRHFPQFARGSWPSIFTQQLPRETDKSKSSSTTQRSVALLWLEDWISSYEKNTYTRCHDVSCMRFEVSSSYVKCHLISSSCIILYHHHVSSYIIIMYHLISAYTIIIHHIVSAYMIIIHHLISA